MHEFFKNKIHNYVHAIILILNTCYIKYTIKQIHVIHNAPGHCLGSPPVKARPELIVWPVRPWPDWFLAMVLN